MSSKMRIDALLLDQLGLGSLRPDLARLALTCMYDVLTIRVGTDLADRMSSRQLAEFRALYAAGNEDASYRWLQANFPDHPSIVRARFEGLCEEVAGEAQKILSQISNLLAE